MKISCNWLNDFLPDYIEMERLAQILTCIGLEVESVSTYSNVKGSLAHCVVGYVVRCEDHPNAQRLKLLQVEVDGQQFLQIICGAPNIAIGQKVIVAKEGAVLTTFSGKIFPIQKVTLRGYVSEGMVCSLSELGIKEDKEGIVVLPDEVPTGMAAANYFSVYEDTILDISITPNRTDCMSHWGVAREILAYENYHRQEDKQLKLPSFSQIIPPVASPIKVSIPYVGCCTRFTGIVIKNIQVQAAPQWMQHRLNAIGIRTINNIVDLTNYILHGYGHPVHAYDMDKISEEQLEVGYATEGTSFTLLDGSTITLHQEDIVIRDGQNNILALAGVMGGKESAITEHTHSVFFEVAHFPSLIIRKMALRHNLRTEAALHFEKNVDISTCLQVLKILLALLFEDGKDVRIEGGIVDVTNIQLDKKHLIIPYQFIDELSGRQYDRDRVRKILIGLEFEILNEFQDKIEVAVPFHKNDMDTPYDIVEEIMRIDGLDKVPLEIKGDGNTSSSEKELRHFVKNEMHIWQDHILDYLSALGWQEILTSPIIDKGKYVHVSEEEMIALANPLSTFHNALRPDTLYSGVEAIVFNQNRQHKELRFFELGKQYHRKGAHYEEEKVLSLWASGNVNSVHWQVPVRSFSVYDMKGVVERLWEYWHIKGVVAKVCSSYNQAWSHMLTYTKEGCVLARVGILSPAHLRKWEVEVPIYMAVLYVQPIYSLRPQYLPTYQSLSKYPVVSRDISLLVDKQVPYIALEEAIFSLQIDALHSLQVLDIFEDDKLGKDKKSLTLRIDFLSYDHTFMDEEIVALMQRILDVLAVQCAAKIRVV